MELDRCQKFYFFFIFCVVDAFPKHQEVLCLLYADHFFGNLIVGLIHRKSRQDRDIKLNKDISLALAGRWPLQGEKAGQGEQAE